MTLQNGGAQEAQRLTRVGLERLGLPESAATELQSLLLEAMASGARQAANDLLTVEDVAAHFGINTRRARALAQRRHEQLGIGRKVSGWVFTPDELPHLAPGKPGRPPKRSKENWVFPSAGTAPHTAGR